MATSKEGAGVHARSNEFSNLLYEACEGEIIGEAMYLELKDFAIDDRQRQACQLLAELERVTGEALVPMKLRHGVEVDRAAAWAEGEEYTRREAPAGWVAYFEGVAPLAEKALNGMRRLHSISDGQDRAAASRLVAHEEAFMEFVHLELAGSEASLEPLERFLDDER